MITINWLFIPFTITIILMFMAMIFQGLSSPNASLYILAGISFVISAIIYIIYGVYWMITHIQII
jgi:hypothetical protein